MDEQIKLVGDWKPEGEYVAEITTYPLTTDVAAIQRLQEKGRKDSSKVAKDWLALGYMSEDDYLKHLEESADGVVR